MTHPTAGQTVTSPIHVAGCSSTFESNVVWELIAQNGRVIASGHTMGGGLGSPGPFNIEVEYSSEDKQLGHLHVFELDESEGEGFPSGRTTLPLILSP
ncbi:MAG: hypothetical protein HKN37_13455 [Rhodothermales bacterium]|nr:hypothetical protein [Rhodothermales bacterium]